MNSQARVVVIGGGAMGCSLLYHLTQLGWTDVVLVEKNELTAGSTWHAAGLCTHFAHNLTIMQMRAYSARLYGGELARDTGCPVGFHRSGALRVTRSADRMDEFRHVQALGRFVNQEFHLLTPSELKAIYPLVETDGLLGAFYEPNDGYVDPSQATQAMAAGARARGAEIYRHNPVERLEPQRGGGWLVHTREGTIRTEVIVNAAGTWAREIGLMMGIDLPVVPMLHQYLVTERIEAVATRATELPIIRDPEESWYVRQERDGLILGPYERDGHPWAIDGVPPEFGMELLPPDLTRVESILLDAMRRVPALAEAGIKTVVNGPITFTPDASPLIGPAYGLPGAWLLTGSSMGVMEGGGAGRFLADWIVHGEPPMDELAVDPRRFGDWADRDYRVAKAVESFANQFGIHYPYEERPAGRPRRIAPTYDAHVQAGALFGFVNGWERPNWYAAESPAVEPVPTFRRPTWHEAVARECAVVAEHVGIADLSHLSKFEVRGPDATGLVAALGANTPPRMGGIVLTHALTPSGGVAAEYTVTRLAADHYYLTSAAAAERRDYEALAVLAARYPRATIESLTDAFGVIAIAGPSARTLLARLTRSALDNSAFPWLAAREIEVAGCAVRALRMSYVGELGWELHARVSDLAELHSALSEAGRNLELAPFGAYAMNAMRLEKGYPAWGADLSTERTPLEAGLSRFVKLEGHEFDGRMALVTQRHARSSMALTLLALEPGDVDPFYGHPVLRDGAVVGLVSSGAYGHRVGSALAFAYLAEGHETAPDGALRIRILDQERGVRILARAPYDPDHRRVRA